VAKSQRPQREAKKAPQPIPPIPELGKLHKPRKGNRKAAKLIASGVRLWDRRHVERSARRVTIARNEAMEERRNTDRAVHDFLVALIDAAPSWKFGGQREVVEPRTEGEVPVEELIAAAVGLTVANPTPYEFSFAVAGLTHREHIRLRTELPWGITSYSIYHERTATLENYNDHTLWNYDPRKSGPLPEGR